MLPALRSPLRYAGVHDEPESAQSVQAGGKQKRYDLPSDRRDDRGETNPAGFGVGKLSKTSSLSAPLGVISFKRKLLLEASIS